MSLTKPTLDNLRAAGTTVGDVYFPQTKLLLPFDGSNGATSTADSSNSNHTLTFGGSAQISTAQSKFGGSSLYFSGSGDYVSTATSSQDFNLFNASAWTIEFWMYWDTVTANLISSSGQNALIFGINGGVGAWGGTTGMHVYMFLVNNGGTKQFYFQFPSTSNACNPCTVISPSLASAVTDQTWQHVALSRASNGTLTAYIDGTSVGSTSTAISAPTGNTYVHLGALSSSTQTANLYLDDVRITKGSARYTSAFTAPTTAHLTSAGDVNKQIIVNSAADGVAIGTGGINQARIAKAWAQFKMTDHTVTDSYNVSSITDIATGSCYINFSTSMSGTDYACATSGATYSGGATNYSNGAIADTAARARWYRESAGGAGHDTGLACSIIVFGN